MVIESAITLHVFAVFYLCICSCDCDGKPSKIASVWHKKLP